MASRIDTKVLERIRKLLALSTSPNDHEAETALHLAYELMARHGLELADIPLAQSRSGMPAGHAPTNDDVVDLWCYGFALYEGHVPNWKSVFAHALARLHGCVVYTQDGSASETVLCIIGRRSQAALIKEFFDAFCMEVELRSFARGYFEDPEADEDFRMGLCESLVARVRSVRRKRLEQIRRAAFNARRAQRPFAVQRYDARSDYAAANRIANDLDLEDNGRVSVRKTWHYDVGVREAALVDVERNPKISSSCDLDETSEARQRILRG